MIESLLIANRGEIARRILRTARRLGVRTIAVHSDVDAGLPFVAEADQAVCIGPAPARESYLDQAKILAAARATGVKRSTRTTSTPAEAQAMAKDEPARPPPITKISQARERSAELAVADAGVMVMSEKSLSQER